MAGQRREQRPRERASPPDDAGAAQPAELLTDGPRSTGTDQRKGRCWESATAIDGPNSSVKDTDSHHVKTKENPSLRARQELKRKVAKV